MNHFMKILMTLLLFSLANATAKTRNYEKQFHIGVTGIHAKGAEGKLAVTEVVPGSPADGKLKAGDVLLSVNGASLAVEDPRRVLGPAINQAEGADGKLKFEVEGSTKTATLQLKPIGSYAETWPLDCKKSKLIVKQAAEFLLTQEPSRGIAGALDGLFLLSTGEPKCIQAAGRWAEHFAEKPISHNWSNGYHGIFLGEYYLATGDKRVLPAIKELADVAAEREIMGGWNHYGKTPNPGYVNGGTINAAGINILTSLILARECGVEVNEICYERSFRFFSRFAGHGSVSYGNHPPSEYVGTNGKNPMLACALTLLPQEKFQSAAKLAALGGIDTYGPEGGHGSHLTNVIWRPIAGALVLDHKPGNHRRCMNELIWYYDLCRLPGGTGALQPTPRRDGLKGFGNPHSTGLIGLAYTAPLKTLRITGKPRTRWSVKYQPNKVEEAFEYTDFQRFDCVAGGDDVGLPPEELLAKFDAISESPEELLKLMHHYQWGVRLRAALALGSMGEAAHEQILTALKSPDARLRTAGLCAIHGTRSFWFWNDRILEQTVSPKAISEHYLPYILAPLKKADAPMWEKVNALLALRRAAPETVIENVKVIQPYLTNEEWWVRAAAWHAMASAAERDAGVLKQILPDLMVSLESTATVHAHRTMMWYLKRFQSAHPEMASEVVLHLAGEMVEQPVREKTTLEAYDANKIFEALRFINMKDHPGHVIPLLPAMQRWMKHGDGLGGGLHAIWVFTGARWGNEGLIYCADKLGKDGGPVIAAMKAMLPDLERIASKDRRMKEVLTKVEECIARHEAKYGEVKPAPQPVEPKPKP